MKAGTTQVQRYLAFLVLLSMVAVLALPLPGAPVLADMPSEELEPEVRMVGYDVATGEEIEEVASPLNGPLAGGLPEDVSLDSPQAPELAWSDFISRTNTTEYPYKTTARLISTWSGTGNWKACSGVMIDPFWVVTSGRCAHDVDSDYGGWASMIEVTPAYSHGYEPYDSSYAKQFWSWTSWTQDQNEDWDLAYLELYRPVGALSGWVGLGWNTSDSFYTGNTFENCAYPQKRADPNPYDWYMHCWEGQFGLAHTHRVYHSSYLPDSPTQGMEGSPALWYSASTGWDAWAIYSEEACYEGCSYNYTRITEGKYDDIYEKVANGTPSQPDLIPLDVNVEPELLIAGETVDSMNFYLHNYSTAAWSGTVGLQFYLSRDGTITSDDILLKTTTYTGSLGAKKSKRITVSSGDLPTIPVSAVDFYWIGILLTTSDANNDNNGTVSPDSVPVEVSGVTEEGIRSIDLTISLYKKVTTQAEKDKYEEIIDHFADAIYEESNGAHKLRSVAFYDDGRRSSADIVWTQKQWPCANLSAFGEGRSGQIKMGDKMPRYDKNDKEIAPYDFLLANNRCEAGWTLGHEMGHYYYGLRDDYLYEDDAKNPGDGPQFSVMNSQWLVCERESDGRAADPDWGNFSVKRYMDTAKEKEKVPQWKYYQASGWETLARSPTQDPPDAYVGAVWERDHFAELADVAPTGNNFATLELPDAEARSQLQVQWVEATASVASPQAAYEAAVHSTMGGSIQYPEPVPLMASVRGEELLTKVGVEATVSGPGGSQSLTLKDDGVAPDDTAGDGWYSALMPYDQNGSYYVSVSFDNDAGTAETTQLSYDHAVGPDGEVWKPQSESVTESFNATANTTVVVSGVQDDDHGDAPIEATTLVPNNVDVPGQIDHAGDKDVFVVTPSAKGEIIVRLSGFAFGMKPKIRLLHSNAVTVLDSFTFTPAEGTYFSTRLDVKASEPFYVEVSHTNSSATQGFYYVSAGWSERSYQETIKARVYLPIVMRK